MISLFLFLAIAFLLTFLIGRLLKRIRIPWVFAALIIGTLLAIYNPFSSITSSPTFEFLEQLGMYFLLFIIGFEIDLKKFKKNRKFIFKATLFIIFLEAIFGTLLIHFVFGYSWFIASLVALSFATVGEAILIPILDEFKIVNTKLGQSIIGIGTLDDILEILLLIFVSIFIGSKVHSEFNIISTLISLAILILLTFGLNKLKKHNKKLNSFSTSTLCLLLFFGLFLFLGIGELAHIAPFAALLAGIAINSFIPKNLKEKVKSGVKTFGYGLFVPIFFLGVGLTMDMKYLIAFPLAILLVVLVSNSAKLLGSWLIGRKELGTKQSLLLGIGLSVRFSTSIIIIKILFENGLIGIDLYSIIVASSIIFKFGVPFLFSKLLTKWKITK